MTIASWPRLVSSVGYNLVLEAKDAGFPDSPLSFMVMDDALNSSQS